MDNLVTIMIQREYVKIVIPNVNYALDQAIQNALSVNQIIIYHL